MEDMNMTLNAAKSELEEVERQVLLQEDALQQAVSEQRTPVCALGVLRHMLPGNSHGGKKHQQTITCLPCVCR